MEVTSDTICGTCGKPLLHCGHVIHCECDCACIELCDPALQRACDLCLSDDHDGDERGIQKINQFTSIEAKSESFDRPVKRDIYEANDAAERIR